jgi:hypothetical protein
MRKIAVCHTEADRLLFAGVVSARICRTARFLAWESDTQSLALLGTAADPFERNCPLGADKIRAKPHDTTPKDLTPNNLFGPTLTPQV